MHDDFKGGSYAGHLLNDGKAQTGTGAEQEHGSPETYTLPELECTFSADIFEDVMLNLIKNPNITSSLLFRADILLDQDHDTLDKTSHLQEEYRPRSLALPGWSLHRTIVRRLIPRNPQLDRHLVQTCHLLTKDNEYLVVYMPHVDDPKDMPFYHPQVAMLSFYHRDNAHRPSTLTLQYTPFKEVPVNDRLQRTGMNLLQTIEKHGQGKLNGYQKKVHHDQVVDQKTFQDTYARLKVKYAKYLTASWQEVTDPGKHVFEDISIAAFLVELWRATYSKPGAIGDNRPPFPGFVDIGCGNGVLTYILTAEGYKGYGFDARRRKTWSIFPDHVDVRQRLLVPRLLGRSSHDDGVFETGTFIVSNHADELTAWTPLLAYLCQGSFIAIPCCSHDLSGARFRAPMAVRSAAQARLPQQVEDMTKSTKDLSFSQAAETGCLKRTLAQKKMASAYASLCSYVESLTAAVGFEVEREVLRIPSTRNHSIIGRKIIHQPSSYEEREAVVQQIVEEELGKDIAVVAQDWLERAEKLAQKPNSGH